MASRHVVLVEDVVAVGGWIAATSVTYASHVLEALEMLMLHVLEVHLSTLEAVG